MSKKRAPQTLRPHLRFGKLGHLLKPQESNWKGVILDGQQEEVGPNGWERLLVKETEEEEIRR